MAAPQVLYLDVKNHSIKGRPFERMDNLVKRISRDNGISIQYLNDRLFKINDKYYFRQGEDFLALRWGRLVLVEALVIGKAIIGTLTVDPSNVERQGKITHNNVDISFVFKEDGDLADKKTMVKLAMLPQYHDYKCFCHIK